MKVNPETGLKICSRCKKEAPLSEFNKSKDRPDGHDNACRECTQERHRIHYQTHLDKCREVRAAYRKSHKEEYKQYRQEHKEEISARQKQWRLENKEIISAKAKAFREANIEKLKEKSRLSYQRRKTQAKDRALQMKYGITLEQLNAILELQQWKCPGCGRGLELKKGKYAIDHDHSKGVNYRWVLCSNCTFILGHAKDSPEVLETLAGMLKGVK